MAFQTEQSLPKLKYLFKTGGSSIPKIAFFGGLTNAVNIFLKVLIDALV